MTELLLVNVVAGCVLERDNKFLLVQEKQPHVYGLWNLPAGRVDEGETFEQAAIRETEEETGFVVRLGDKLPVEHQSIKTPVLHAYKATIVSGELLFSADELLDAQWFSLDQIKTLQKDGKLRNDWVLRTIERSLAE